MTDPYVRPGDFIDSDDLTVIEFAVTAVEGEDDPRQRAIRLCRAVRDGIRYDPYVSIFDPENFRASAVLKAGRGFCIGKATLLAACGRAVGIPAGVGYADVRNHMNSPRLYALMKSDLFVWHSFTEFLLDGQWVKATPAFDRGLCERVRIPALDFDGRSDSLFHAFDKAGRRHMEYVRFRGRFPDVPFATIAEAFRTHYPDLLRHQGLSGDFRVEAAVPDR